MPGIGDPRFEKAVVAMCRHDADGALGIGIGRVLPDMRFHALLEQLGIKPDAVADAPVHAGGPVEPQRGFVLHSRDWGGRETLDVCGKWALTGTLDILRALAAGMGPSQWVVALGYAGWGPGQLEGEMKRHGWQLAEGTDAIVFDTPAAARWEASFAAQGIDPRWLSSGSGRA